MVPDSDVSSFFFLHSTVWRKQSSGLQYLGSSWFQKGSSRVRCPHSDFVKGKYSLEINDVNVEDGGLYKCKVEFKGRVIEKEIMLRVLQGKKLKVLV